MSEKSKLAANSQVSAMRLNKKRGAGRPFKPGQSGNLKGTPKRGTSWAEVIKWAADSTPGQLVKYLQSGELESAFRKMPSPVTMKRLIVLRWFVAQMNEPSPALAGLILNRSEGKVSDNIGGATKIVYVGRDSKWESNGPIPIEATEAVQKQLKA